MLGNRQHHKSIGRDIRQWNSYFLEHRDDKRPSNGQKIIEAEISYNKEIILNR